MIVKPKYNWQQQKERSVFDLVTEDGVMRPKEILHIVRQLCRILDSRSHEEASRENGCIHPQTIIVNSGGTVYLSALALPLSTRAAYIPPEQEQFTETVFESAVYALGILMLFMATGNEKKADLDTSVGDSSLRALITRCTAFDPRMRFQNTKELSGSIRRTRGIIKKAALILLLITFTGAAVTGILGLYQRGSENGETSGKELGYLEGYIYGYEKGFSDSPGIGIDGASFDSEMGNLSGNLAQENGAIAACSETEIFFLYEGSIYRMDPYTESIQALVTGAGARGLNYYDGWLYYCTNEKVLRVNPETMKEEIFCDSRTGLLYIADGAFYLHDIAGTGYLYRINTDTGALTQLSDITEYRCLNIVGNRLYFLDAGKGNLYRSELDGSGRKLLNSNYCESFCIYDDKIYAYGASFEEDAVNYSASSLICMDLDGGSIENFTNIPAYYPNVTDSGIFYIAGNNRTLEWMSLNGRTRYTVLSSRTGFYNIAGRWIFYLNEEDGGALWRVRIDGSDNTKVMH